MKEYNCHDFFNKSILFASTLILLCFPNPCFADDIYQARRDFMKKLSADSLRFENIIRHCTSNGKRKMLSIYDNYVTGISGEIGKEIIRNCPSHIVKLKRSLLSEDEAEYLSHFISIGRSKTKNMGIRAGDMGDYWQLYSCHSSLWKPEECVEIVNNDLSFIRNYIYLEY